MSWTELVTLVAALIAAGAAVWAAYISQKQLSFAKDAAKPELPIVEVTIRDVPNQPEWTALYVEMRNRAAIPVDWTAARVKRPKGTGLLSVGSEYNSRNNPLNERQLAFPLPSDKVVAKALVDRKLGARGGVGLHGPTEIIYQTIYAHCPPHHFQDGRSSSSSLSFEMRWRDHSAKTFAMAVTIIKPATM